MSLVYPTCESVFSLGFFIELIDLSRLDHPCGVFQHFGSLFVRVQGFKCDHLGLCLAFLGLYISTWWWVRGIFPCGFAPRGSLACAIAPLLSQYKVMGSAMVGTTPSSVMNFLIHTASFAASDAAIYSDTVVDRALLGTLPTNAATVQEKHISRL